MKTRLCTGLILVIGFFAASLMLGCSGGGGGSGSGTGLDPIEVEINAEMDTFLAGVNKNNLDQAMSEIDSNLSYFRSGNQAPTRPGFNLFRSSLSAFLGGAASVSVSLVSRSVSPSGENLARVRAVLSYSYKDGNGIERTAQENCEMVWERVSRWGITSLSSFNAQSTLVGLAFPPVP